MDTGMLKRIRLVIALASVAILLLQGTIASAAALACIRACAEKNPASCQPKQPSCHSGGEKDSKSTKHDCDGACSTICASDKSKAIPIEGLAFQVPSYEIAAIVPVTSLLEFGIPETAPELYETDSSPPRPSPVSTHSLRAPPTPRA